MALLPWDGQCSSNMRHCLHVSSPQRVGGGRRDPGALQRGPAVLSDLSKPPTYWDLHLLLPPISIRPFPLPWPPGWSQCPRRTTKPRLTPCWAPACCWYHSPQHLILVLHPGRGGRWVSLSRDHTPSPAPPGVQPSPPSPPLGDRPEGTTGTGWRPQEVGLSIPSYIGTLCPFYLCPVMSWWPQPGP